MLEIYNGCPGVRNYGDERHPSVERMWDIVLTRRLAELKLPVIYATAGDGAREFTDFGPGLANPGRGWIMVRTDDLSQPAILEALDRGQFYATTGVLLNDVRFDGETLSIDIAPRYGVSHRTQFIGTTRGYDATSTTQPGEPGERLSHVYSPQVGRVLLEQAGDRVSYRMTGSEIYVRAKVISTAPHPNPHATGDLQVAWIQPVQPSVSTRPAAVR